jgi:hypothetical protein
LELAAKAAGVKIFGFAYDGERLLYCDVGENEVVQWNPLTADGDALRLVVKLKMGISIPVHRTIKADVVCFTDSSVNIREEGQDPYAATRRAIVRAAAEIGKTMKGESNGN